jgi:CheY-like chemotaxis protein
MSQSSKTILLVEDNLKTQFLIQHSFELANLVVFFQVVNNGEEAIDYLQQQAKINSNYLLPIIIVTSVNTTRVSGFELLAWAKQHSQFKNLPIIMISNSDAQKEVIKAATLGAYAYLIKRPPFDDLVDVVSRLIL